MENSGRLPLPSAHRQSGDTAKSQSFQGISTDGEIFEPSPTTHDKGLLRNGPAGHISSYIIANAMPTRRLSPNLSVVDPNAIGHEITLHNIRQGTECHHSPCCQPPDEHI